MHEGYSDRMLRAPRFVREGHRLIPIEALVRVRTVKFDGTPPCDEGEQ